MKVPPLDREILGAPSLEEFLRHTPDALDFDLAGVSNTDDFRLIYLNVHGMDGFKLIELFTVIFLQDVDIMVPIDARLDVQQHSYFLAEVLAKLGQSAKLLACYRSISADPNARKVGHVLTLSLLYRMSSYVAGADSGWIGLSDHRPLSVANSSIPSN